MYYTYTIRANNNRKVKIDVVITASNKQEAYDIFSTEWRFHEVLECDIDGNEITMTEALEPLFKITEIKGVEFL